MNDAEKAQVCRDAASTATTPVVQAAFEEAAEYFEARETDGERCHDCGGPVDLVWWCHDDLLWEVVTGEVKPAGSRESAAGILCISCFDRKAREVCPWIEWAPVNLRHLLDKEVQEEAARKRWDLAGEHEGTSMEEIRERHGTEPGTLEEFEAEHGPVQPPDGEG